MRESPVYGRPSRFDGSGAGYGTWCGDGCGLGSYGTNDAAHDGSGYGCAEYGQGNDYTHGHGGFWSKHLKECGIKKPKLGDGRGDRWINELVCP